MKDFAIFIITHGRPENQRTLKTLQDLDCKEKIWLVLDNQDETIQQYLDLYGKDNIIVFDKNELVKLTDTGLSDPVYKFAVYARNAVEIIAKELGLKTFLVLDDDITKFRYRYDEAGSLKSTSLKGSFDKILSLCIDYVLDTDIGCLGFGFCNIYRSGVSALYEENPRQRLCAEAFLRNVSHPIKWRLNMVEDLITSLDAAICGDVWFQFLPLQVEIFMSEGLVPGGNSDAYVDFGKYKLSFMPTLVYPSCTCPRIVHSRWATTTKASDSIPRLLSDFYAHHLHIE